MLNKILFTVFAVVLFSLSYYAQDHRPQAYKFADFGPTSAGVIAAKMKAFDDELNAKESAQGYIINYGTPKAITTRRNLLIKGVISRRYDTSRITFIDGPFERKVRTVMWIVPAGAEKPVP